MRLSIKYKIFLAILSAHILVYLAIYGYARYNFTQGFLDYVSRSEERLVPALINNLENFYEHTGSWEPIRTNRQTVNDLIFQSVDASYDPSQPVNRPLNRLSPGRTTANDWYYSSEYSPARPHLLLLDGEKNILWGDAEALPLAILNPILARGETVGYLAVTSRQELSERADLLFAEQQEKSFLLIAAVLVLVSAIVIAFPVASVLVRPIHDVVSGTRALSSGDYGARIKVRGSDEVAQLAQDFNSLAKTLEQNSKARQQWIADISHELRTPLAILRGELESLQDGIRPLTPESLESLHHEVVHLNELVNDLHELSLSDLGALIYEKEQINLVKVLAQSLELHQPQLDRQDIALECSVQALNGSQEIRLLADPKRLEQLFANLLQNTCRYTEHGGRLVIQVKEAAESVSIEWYDSEPGVQDQDLDHLFDRLYRVESSRNREQGGSGLGLGICKNIVEAHEGTISASHSPLGGLRLSITFPRKLNQVA